MDRKHLAMALSRIPDPPDARTEREQVRTPGAIAADLLRTIDDAEGLDGKHVVDLGSGTGVLSIGAALLGAARVLGLEIDPALPPVAQRAAQEADVAERVRFLERDVAHADPAEVEAALGGRADLVIMNPPFGADLVSRARGGDRVFLSLAFRLAPTVYSFHLSETERFLSAYARDAGFNAERAFVVDWPLAARFAHHRAETRIVQVGAYRFKKA